MFWIKRCRRIADLVKMSNKLTDQANLCLDRARECHKLAELYLETLPGTDVEKELEQ